MAKQTGPVGGFTPIEVPVINETALPGFTPFEVTPVDQLATAQSGAKRRRGTTNAPSGENQEH